MMRADLRWGRLWLALGWTVVIAALTLNLMPGRELPNIQINDKLEHLAGYVLLTLFFCGIYPRTSYWRVAILFVLMGAGVEVLQGLMHWGRSADIRDFYADCMGIAMGLLFASAGLSQWPRWLERLFMRTVAEPHE